MKSKISVIINRLNKGDKQITGELWVLNNDIKVFDCKTLELPDLDNYPRISCIPYGSYTVKKRWSKKFKNHFHIQDVEGRSYILIHSGNYYTQILGCVLVGTDLRDINNDDIKDVVNSKKTMGILNGLLPDEFNLEIV